jgi:DNA polymerase
MELAHAGPYQLLGSASLDTLGQWYGVSRRVDKGALARMKRRQLDDLSSEQLETFRQYTIDDVVTCREILRRADIDANEGRLVTWTIEQAIYPRLRADIALLRTTAARAEEELDQCCARLGVTRAQLASSAQFAALLAQLGVEVPKKRTKAGETWALAKSDAFMLELLDSDDAQLAALAEARLRVKSTIERTRAERMADVATACGGWLPVPLHYHKARTGRWTGAARLNMQNLSRGSGPLRQAIMAPEGQRLVVVDAAQIEARIVACLAGAHELLDAFAAGRDVYAETASALYGVHVTKETHPRERQVGKLAVLSLGYGCGPMKFKWIASVQGGVELTDVEAERIVRTYRALHAQIPALWQWLDHLLWTLAATDTGSFTLPMCPTYSLTWRAPWLYLPSGRRLALPLRVDEATGRLLVASPAHGKLVEQPIWGGRLTENLVQAAARDVLCRTHLQFLPDVVHQVHDELVLLTDAANAKELAADVEASLSAPVEWLRGCPLKAESKITVRYGDAK